MHFPRIPLALMGALIAASQALAAPVFIEDTAGSGVRHSYTGDFRFFVGGGVAVFDCDQDSVPDLYLAGGEGIAALYRNNSAPAGPLNFTAVSGAASLTAVTGAYPLDVDDDGIVDLFVMRVGENVVLRGRGGCEFERANEAWRVDGGAAWTTAFAATWFAGDSLPTLAVGNYTRPGPTSGTFGACQDNQLFRPNGLQFDPPEALTPSYCSLSMLFTSWRGEGAPDLRISNDRQYYPPEGSEQLWRVGPASARPYGVGDGWQPLSIWGMAIATHDVTGNGHPDYYLTSMADNKLRALSDAGAGVLSPVYTDNALTLGVTSHRPSVGDTSRPSTSWHAEFADVDNDASMDLFVAKGNVEDMADFAIADPNALYTRDGATFVDVAPQAGLASTHRGRGAALADFNMDGALDVVVLNRRAPAQVWRNAGAKGGWLQLDVRQYGANTNAIGAWIEVTPLTAAGRPDGPVQRRQLAVGGGHAGGQLTWRHFGLAAAPAARVTVRWPDGGASQWQLAANSNYILRRGDPAAAKVNPDTGSTP